MISRQNDIENENKIIMKKRPTFITIFAILILISVPFDLFNAITLNKGYYQQDVKNNDTLINKGEIVYRDTTVYWKKQSDFAKKGIIKHLDMQKKILDKFSLYRFFKYLFSILSIILFYGLWNLKKWTIISLIVIDLFGIIFNVIFPFLILSNLVLMSILGVALLILMFLFYKKYFIF